MAERQDGDNDFVFDPDTLLSIKGTLRPYRAVVILDDNTTLCTFKNAENQPTLTLKVGFITIPDWKSYIQLSFSVRVARVRYGALKDKREFVALHEAHAFLEHDSIEDMEVQMVTDSSALPAGLQGKKLCEDVERGLIAQMIVVFHPELVRQYGFDFIGTEDYPGFTQAGTLFRGSETSTIRLLLVSNDLILDNMEQFRTSLETTLPDYAAFYPGHPTQHFLQLGDYPSANDRPHVHVPAAPVLSSWSEYSTIYGFGCVAEQEVVNTNRKNVLDHVFKLRVMNVPGARDRFYVGFLEKPDELEARFNTGDRLTVNFNPTRRSEDENWSAMVIDTLPCTPQGDVCISLIRPVNPDTGVPLSQAVNSMSCDIIGMDAAFQLVSRHPSHLVGLDVLTNSKTFKRQIVGLQKLFRDEQCRWWKNFLVGKTMSVLTRSNIYEKCSAEAMSLLKTDHFNDDQRQALDYVKALPNGVGLITGPAATGKSSFILDVLQPFLHVSSSVVGRRSQNINHPRVLICTPDNAAADDLALRLYDLSQHRNSSKDAIIIRMHSISTEKGVLDAATLSSSDSDQSATNADDTTNATITDPEIKISEDNQALHRSNDNHEPVQSKNKTDSDESKDDHDPVDHAEIPQLKIAPIIYHAFHEPNKRRHGVTDKRYVLHNLSLATWMLRVAGLMGDPDDTIADTVRHDSFRVFYESQENDIDMDEEDRAAFGEARKQLREHCFALAQVVITTVSNAGDYALYSAYKPDLIIVDEASRSLEADTWNVLANYAKTPLILIGDEAQLRPVVLSTPDNNGFVYPMKMSLFHRLKLLRHPSVMLRVQYRMVDIMGSMISDLFYDGKLVNGPGTDIPSRPLTQAIMQYVQDRWRVQSPIVLLNVEGNKQRDSTKSSYNLANASVVMHLVVDLLDKGIVTPAQLLVMTFYRAQFKIYRQALRNLSLARPEMAEVQVKTVDTMQGGQAPLIIMDLVACGRLGFLQAKNRMNVAFSRAQDGLIVVGDATNIMKEETKHRRHLGSVITFITNQDANVKFGEPETFPYLPAFLGHEYHQNQSIEDQTVPRVEEVREDEESGRSNDETNVFSANTSTWLETGATLLETGEGAAEVEKGW
jgi:hypothetical protein